MATFLDYLLADVPPTDRAAILAAADTTRSPCTCDPCCPDCCTCPPTSSIADPEGQL